MFLCIFYMKVADDTFYLVLAFLFVRFIYLFGIGLYHNLLDQSCVDGIQITASLLLLQTTPQ